MSGEWAQAEGMAQFIRARRGGNAMHLPRALVLRYKDGALVEEIAPGAKFDSSVCLGLQNYFPNRKPGAYFERAMILFQFRTQRNVV
jgi:hypothetical protein